MVTPLLSLLSENLSCHRRAFCCDRFKVAAVAEAEAGPNAVEEEANLDMDYFDRQDLGKLRRRLRKGIEGFQRERELYLELVHAYLEVSTLLFLKSPE